MKIRPTEAILKANLMNLPHSNLNSFALTPFSNLASATAFLCRFAFVINQLELSTFARVRQPRMIGSMLVRSTPDKLVNIRKDSNSKGVGGCERWPRTKEPPTKSGSCVITGRRYVLNGRQLCSLSSCLRRTANCEYYS